MPIFFILQTAFSLYMLVHATKRGAPQYWWFIILLPFGEWAYFFVVYLPSRKNTFARSFTTFDERPASLESLARSYRHTPSQHNLTRLAQGLYDAGKYAESNERFSELLAEESTDKEALFGYAQSCLALDETEGAVTSFEHLLKEDPDYRNHSVSFELARLYWKAGRKEDCVTLLSRVCKRTARLEPRVELARYLQALERYEEVREILEAGLDSVAGSPAHAQRVARPKVWEAKRILKKLPRRST